MSVLYELTDLSPEVFEFLISMIIKGLIIFAIAGCLNILLRSASAAVRHLVWVLAFGAVSLLPLLILTVPRVGVPVLPSQGGIEAVGSGGQWAEGKESPVGDLNNNYSLWYLDNQDFKNNIVVTEEVGRAEAGTVVDQVEPKVSFSVGQYMLMVWAAGYVVCLWPLCYRLILMGVFQGRCNVLADDSVCELVEDVCRQLNIRKRIKVISNDDETGRYAPMVWGMRAAVLFLPKGSENWDERQMRSVLLHELAHIKRHDWLSQLFGSMVCAAYWFNPLGWYGLRRLRVEREQACDDLVINSGIGHADYAEHLVGIARRLVRSQPVNSAALAMARTSQIESRIKAILDNRKNRRAVTRMMLVGFTILVAVVSIMLAAVEPMERNSKLKNQNSDQKEEGKLQLLAYGEDIELSGKMLTVTPFAERSGKYLYPEGGITLKELLVEVGCKEELYDKVYLKITRDERRESGDSLYRYYSRKLSEVMSDKESDLSLMPRDIILGAVQGQPVRSEMQFGPEVSLIINDDGVGKDFFADLDTGEVMSPPVDMTANSEKEVIEWLKSSSVDVMGETSVSVQGLGAINLKCACQVDNSLWQADASEICARIISGVSDWTALSCENGRITTYVIETSKNNKGVLQILNINDREKKINVRYKLLKDEREAVDSRQLTDKEVVANEVPEVKKPFSIYGRVVDVKGEGMEGVEIWASCGMGTLLTTGKTVSDEDGNYRLSFGPGMWRLDKDKKSINLQCATIHAGRVGYFEQSLCRHGNLGIAGDKQQASSKIWGEGAFAKILLPNEPYKVDFVMVEGAVIEGVVKDAEGNTLKDFRLYLKGDEQYPSTSVLANITTDENGKFVVDSIPNKAYYFEHDDRKSSEIQYESGVKYSIELVVPEGGPELQIKSAEKAVGSGQQVEKGMDPFSGYEVRVVDADGRLAAGVDIDIYTCDSYGWDMPVKAKLTGRVKSDDDGVCRFATDMKASFAVVRMPGMAISWSSNHIYSWEEESVITLGNPKSFSGKVVDGNGRPVAGALVEVSYASIGDGRPKQSLTYTVAPLLFNSRTDSSGKFVINGLPADMEFELLVSKAGMGTVSTISQNKYDFGNPSFSTGQSDVEIILKKAGTVKGQVKAEGVLMPIPGAVLTISHKLERGADRIVFGQEMAVSGINGEFEFGSLAPGKYVIEQYRADNSPAAWVSKPITLDIEAGQVVGDCQMVLSNGGMLEVVAVAEGTRDILDGATVSVQNKETNKWLSFKTGNQGAAEIRLMPGSYEVSLYHGDYYTNERKNIFITKGKRESLEVVLQPKLNMHGVIVGKDGRPMANTKLTLIPGFGPAETDGEGKFNLSWSPDPWRSNNGMEEVYYIVIRDRETEQALVTQAAPQDEPLSLKLEEGVIVAGNAVDSEGRPVAGADVELWIRVANYGSLYARDQVKTGLDGSFEIKTVALGQKYDVKIKADGYGELEHAIETNNVVDGMLDVGELKMLAATMSVSGRVVDVDGRPVANAEVESQGYDGQPEVKVNTDSNGRFVLDGLCEGMVLIQVEGKSGGRVLSTRFRTMAGERGLEVIAFEGKQAWQYIHTRTDEQIKESGKPYIAGVVLDQRNRPAKAAVVEVNAIKRPREEEGKYSWTYSTYQTFRDTTDKDGKFIFELETEKNSEYDIKVHPVNDTPVFVYNVKPNTSDLKVVLPKGGTVTGMVCRMVNGEKKPVPNAEVKLEQTDRSSNSHLGFEHDVMVKTDSSGRYSFKNIRMKQRSDRYENGYIPRTWVLKYNDITEPFTFYDDDIYELEIDLVLPESE